jgi:cell division septation protein DedD
LAQAADHKDKKKLLTLIAIAVLALIALVLIFSKRPGELSGEKPVVLASKRVKLGPEELAEARLEDASERPEEAPVELSALRKAAPRKQVKLAAPALKAAKPVSGKPAAKAAKEGSRPWAINIASFSTASSARTLKAKLESYGYNAYLTEFDKDDRTWHRVRVGFYRSRDEAMKAGAVLKKKRLVPSDPWVVKPNKSEVSKHIE